MANKKVYFYKVTVRETISNKDTTNELKSIFGNIFSKNSIPINSGEAKSMALHNAGQEISLDILSDDAMWCFARVGKKKDPAYNIIRDNTTKDYDYVLSESELSKKSLESCTYFLINYSTGLVSFILGKDAPNVQVLVNIVNEFEQNYIMCIDNILNSESVSKLVVPGAVLNKIQYTFRTPNVDVLRTLGLNREQITELGLMDVSEIHLLIKNEPHKYLSKEPECIEKLINTLKKLPKQLRETFSLTGRTPNTASKPYGFKEENMYFNVDIPNEKVKDGVKVKLTPDDIANDIYSKLKLLYNSNEGELLCMANIE
ncbi:TPA: hypothetical protein ACXNW8_000195 [Clostridium botulinum]